MNELSDFFNTTGFSHLDYRHLLMILIGSLFLYLAISKDWEPYELLPMGLGILIANLPLTGLMAIPTDESGFQEAGIFGILFHYGLSYWNILPPIIFLGIGALTDFGPIIANPKTLLLGAASQVGIFVAFWGAIVLGDFGFNFGIKEAASIAIIGGADGPTTIFLTSRLAPDLLGITAVIAYSYMAAVAFIQPPLMRLMTTKKERMIVMKDLREVSKFEKIIFPTLAMTLIILIVPKSAPLISMFMIGNVFKESNVVPRLTNAASNEILNITTVFLMITVGTQLTADRMFQWETILILGLGLVAFSFGTLGGLFFAKIMNLFLKNKINPLIGSAGVSAVPMAARISHQMGQKSNPQTFLLTHAMGPNVAGVIGSAVIAGVFISLAG